MRPPIALFDPGSGPAPLADQIELYSHTQGASYASVIPATAGQGTRFSLITDSGSRLEVGIAVEQVSKAQATLSVAVCERQGEACRAVDSFTLSPSLRTDTRHSNAQHSRETTDYSFMLRASAVRPERVVPAG